MKLFIGGKADGKRMVVSNDMPFIRIPKPRPSVFLEPSEIASSLEHETYRRSTLAYGNQRWEVFILNSIPEHQVIPMLIQGYRKPSE